MSKCKIHNVRFYKPKPEAIQCMAFERSRYRLAVLRADWSIEIWNLKDSPFIERTLPCSANNSNIESIAWYKDRLFSVGLHGFLTEYNLFTLCKKHVASVTGEAAYCLDIHARGLIAVGTEQGFINIFNITLDSVMFNKFLDKQEGRILCLKFDPSGSYIASGSVDTVRIWDVSSGHALHKMSTGRTRESRETVVWCIDILNDLTVFTGDSRGKLTLWDGKIGAQIESYQSHKADILSLILSSDEKTLYCAGVDPNIVCYVKVQVKGENHKWVKSIERKVHDHDVKSLALFDEKVFSGGEDGYLSCSYYPPKTLLKYPPLLQNPCITLSRKMRYILLRYSKGLELWALGESGKSTEDSNYSGLLPLVRNPKKLIKLRRTVREDDGTEIIEGIICSAMSDDGKWIVFSTDTSLRLFQFELNEENRPNIIPIEDIPEEVVPAVQVLFLTNDKSQLILASRLGGLQVLALGNDSVMLSQNIDTHDVFEDTISLLTCSSCGKYLVAGDVQSSIAVWIKKGYKWEKYCKLPKYNSAPTALSMQPQTTILVVVYADKKVVEYDLKAKEFTAFSRNLDKMNIDKLVLKLFPIRNVTFDPKKREVLLLHDDSNIIVIDKAKKLPPPASKIPKIDSSVLLSESEENIQALSQRHAIHSIKKYKHLVHFEWLSDNEMVAVEVSPLSLLEQLPPCLKQNTFGTK